MMFVLQALTRPPKFKAWGMNSTFQLEGCQVYISEEYVRWEMMWVFLKNTICQTEYVVHTMEIICITQERR